MQKFNEKFVENSLQILEVKTKSIGEILTAEETLSSESIDTISSLYDQRKEILDLLQSWYESNESQEYFRKNKVYWLKKISSLVAEDKVHLQHIENRVKDLGTKLRLLAKQKALLIYTKDKNYDY